MPTLHTQTLTRGWKVGNEAISADDVISAEGSQSLNTEIPAESTDLLVVFALDVSTLKLLHMQCDQDCVIETNSGSAAGATITLKNGKPLQWSPDCGYANPLGATDVTALYVTMVAEVAALLQIRVLYDTTPTP